ncbi:MAG: IPT/TIG domain-containing protein, partial [Candidatus Tumulicola sp.]
MIFTVAAFAPLVVLAATGTPPPSPGPTATPTLTGDQIVKVDTMFAWLSGGVWLTAVIALVGSAVVYFWSRRKITESAPVDDKELEQARIIYGFWLIVAGLFLTLAVVTLTVNLFRPEQVGTADILAVVSSVTGIVGTLIAAFFGIQAAGAGRSQALTALGKLQSGNQAGSGSCKLDPGYGPHAGNTRVSVTGNGFTGATAINFGMTQGVGFEFVNDGLVRATSPPSDTKAKSDADVTVVFPTAATRNVPVGTFYYYTLDPPKGPVAGGTPVTIIGTGLTGAVSVSFGTIAVPGPKTDANGNLVVDAPASTTPGQVDVTVTFPSDSTTNT